MILFFHLLTGGLLASIIQNVPLALSLALLSHYFLDFLPHKEYSIKNIKNKKWKKSLPDFVKLGLDFLVGILVVIILFDNIFLALSGAFLGVFPDFLVFLSLIIPSKILKYHSKIHRKIHCPKNN